MLGSCLVGHDAVVIKVSDHGTVEDILFGMDVEIAHLLWACRLGSPGLAGFIPVYLLSHLPPLPAPTNLGQQIGFLYHPGNVTTTMVAFPTSVTVVSVPMTLMAKPTAVPGNQHLRAVPALIHQGLHQPPPPARIGIYLSASFSPSRPRFSGFCFSLVGPFFFYFMSFHKVLCTLLSVL